MSYPSMLREMNDAALARAHVCARRSVLAWSRAAQAHGSLLQSWIHGQEVHVLERYPDPDIIDGRHGYQFFYHSHRHGALEHGHVHLFHHASASGNRRYVSRERNPWQRTAPSHLLGISLNNRGLPIGLFTVNLWVTDGHWFDAATTLEMVRRFRVEVEGAHSLSSEWLTGFVGMYAPLIEKLLQRRDAILAKALGARSMTALLDDRRHEVLSTIRIDWLRDIEALEGELARRLTR